MVFGPGALAVGIALVVIGTRFRSTDAGSVLIILGGAIAAVSVIIADMEGLSREA